MVRLTSSLITAFLACTTLASSIEQANSTKEQLVAHYGPISTWNKVKLVDAFPDALIDGKPADPSIVYQRMPPSVANKTPTTALVSPREDGWACYNAITSVMYTSQYQLRSMKSRFCTEAQNHQTDNPFGFGIDFGAQYDMYLSESGSWANFTDSNGTVVPSVYYWIQVNNGFVFKMKHCLKAMDTILDCHGDTPETAVYTRGGDYQSRKTIATVWPADYPRSGGGFHAM